MRVSLLLSLLLPVAACSSAPTNEGLPDATLPDADAPDAAAWVELEFPAPAPRDPALYAHPQDEVLRINHLQLKATHNSYHVAPSDETIPDWSYTHAPLDVQLDEQGVRGVELDLWFDAATGVHDVFHFPIVDAKTNCETLPECLLTMRDWSDAHPGHHPIFVQIEPKSTIPDGELEAQLSRIDAQIRAVLPPELLITPDDVRRGEDTLAEALAEHGWPTLGESRGRFLFSFDCSRALALAYAGPEGKLEGRVMFPDSRADDPFAGFMVINSPGEAAQAAAEAGFLVRVFAESLSDLLTDGEQPEDGELRLQAALESGAHVISTDVPAPRDDLDYVTEIPEGTPSRCNPVTAPPECTSLALEDPSLIAAP
jgi:hypothetical protein